MLPVPELREMFPAEAEPRVLEKLMAEFTVLRMTVPAPRVVALAKVMVPPPAVVVISPEVVIPPVPVKDTAPREEISPEMVIAPALDKVTAPCEVTSPEVMIPPAPVKDTAPCELISPVALIVSVPVSALSVTTGEAVVVVTAPLRTMLSATKFNPATAL